LRVVDSRISNVIPAKAGIHPGHHRFNAWIPAFAGMTSESEWPG
jgi:hypothetical protein